MLKRNALLLKSHRTYVYEAFELIFWNYVYLYKFWINRKTIIYDKTIKWRVKVVIIISSRIYP